MLVHIAASTTTSTAEHATTDPALERVVWLLIAAVVGLLVTQGWQSWRARRERRARDQAILSAVLRELAVIAGTASAIQRDLMREQQLLATIQQWRLKPLLRLPTSTYDLVKADPPAALLAFPSAIVDLVGCMSQCAFTNALADQQMRWKAPAARGQADQIEIITSFHAPIMESVNGVVQRVNRLMPIIHQAGQRVGGLNLEGPPRDLGEQPAPPLPDGRPRP